MIGKLLSCPAFIMKKYGNFTYKECASHWEKSVRALGHINFKANYFNIHSVMDGYTLPFIHA
jgi:hypothetical protein